MLNTLLLRTQGKTVTLKLKNVNFEVKTKAFTLQCAVCTEEEILAAAKDLLKAEIDHVSPLPLRLRLMGTQFRLFAFFFSVMSPQLLLLMFDKHIIEKPPLTMTIL